MNTTVLLAFIFSVFYLKCPALHFRCFEDETILDADKCCQEPNVLTCVRKWQHDDNGSVVFISTNKTCCHSNRTVADLRLQEMAGSFVCFKESPPEIPITSSTIVTSTPAMSTTTRLGTTISSTATTSVAPTTTTTATASTTTAGICNTGWTRIGDTCFKHINTKLTWANAQPHCQSLGGNLAHVYTLSYLTDFVPLLTCPDGAECEPFLGINDVAVEGDFVGVVGQTVAAEVAATATDNSADVDCSYLEPGYAILKFWDCTDPDTFICESSLI